MAVEGGSRFLLHECCKRCRKPPKGCVGCAAGFCRPPADSTTVDQCCLAEVPAGVSLANRALVVKETVEMAPASGVLDGEPVCPLDTRCLCLRLQRTCLQDCFTSETNRVLQGCAKDMNTNVSIWNLVYLHVCFWWRCIGIDVNLPEPLTASLWAVFAENRN